MNPYSAAYLNVMERSQFISLFENVVEHTPKVAEELYKSRPFSDNDQSNINSRIKTSLDDIDEKIDEIFSDLV